MTGGAQSKHVELKFHVQVKRNYLVANFGAPLVLPMIPDPRWDQIECFFGIIRMRGFPGIFRCRSCRRRLLRSFLSPGPDIRISLRLRFTEIRG